MFSIVNVILSIVPILVETTAIDAIVNSARKVTDSSRRNYRRPLRPKHKRRKGRGRAP